MPSTDRRTVLASLGAVALGGVAGCASGAPPAGSLRFVNEHTVPHSLSVRVTGVGAAPGDGPGEVRGDPIVPPAQRELSASTVVEPGERRTYEGAFTEPVWYAVRFTVDGDKPENGAGVVTWTPAPDDADGGNLLSGTVYPSGDFSWVISGTENPGPFE